MGTIITFDQDGKRFNYRIAGVVLHQYFFLSGR